jgi:hypothetical protein
VGLIMLIPAFLLILLVGWLLDQIFVEQIDRRVVAMTPKIITRSTAATMSATLPLTAARRTLASLRANTPTSDVPTDVAPPEPTQHIAPPQIVSPQIVSPQIAPPQFAPPQFAPPVNPPKAASPPPQTPVPPTRVPPSPAATPARPTAPKLPLAGKLGVPPAKPMGTVPRPTGLPRRPASDTGVKTFRPPPQPPRPPLPKKGNGDSTPPREPK